MCHVSSVTCHVSRVMCHLSHVMCHVARVTCCMSFFFVFFLHFFLIKKWKEEKKWHVTCDTWQVTGDRWQVTRDTWHVTCDMFGEVNILSKFQLPSSYRLWFMILWRSGGKGSPTELINQLMSNKAVCRTAPATPGLLIMTRLFIEQPWLHRVC